MRRYVPTLFIIAFLSVTGCATTDDLRRVHSDSNRQIQVTNEKIAAVEQGWAPLREEIAKTTQEAIQPLRSSQAEGRAEMTDIKEQLQQIRGTADGLRKELSSLSRQMQVTNEKIAAVEQGWAPLREEIAKTTQEAIQPLRSSQMEGRAEMTDIKEQLQQIRGTADGLRKELSSASATTDDLRRAHSDLSRQMQVTNKKIAAVEQGWAPLREEIVKTTQEAIQPLRSGQAEGRAEMTDIKEQLQQIRVTADGLRKELSSASVTTDDLRRAHSDLSRQMQVTNEKIAAVEQGWSPLRDEIAGVRSEIAKTTQEAIQPLRSSQMEGRAEMTDIKEQLQQIRVTADGLRKELSSASATTDDLRRAHSDLSRQMQVTNKKIAAVEQGWAPLREEIVKTTQEAIQPLRSGQAEGRAEMTDIKEQLQQIRVTADGLRKELSSASVTTDDLRRAHSDLSRQMQVTNEKIAAVEQGWSPLRSEIAKTTQEAIQPLQSGQAEGRAEMTDIQEQLQQIRVTADGLRKELSSASATTDDLRRAHSDLSRQMQVTNEKIAAVEQGWSPLRDEIAGVRSEIAKTTQEAIQPLQSGQAEGRAEMTDIQEQLQQIRGTADGLRKELSSASATTDDLRRAHSDLSRQMQVTNEKIAAVEQGWSPLRDEIAKTTQEAIQPLRSSQVEGRAEMTDIKEQLQQIRVTADGLRKELSSASATTDDLRRAHSDLSRQMQVTNEKIAAVEQGWSPLRDEFAGVRSEIAKTTQAIQPLRSSQAEGRAEMTDIQEQLQQIRGTADGLRKELSSASATTDDLRRAHSDLSRQMQVTNEKIAAVEQGWSPLRDEIAGVRSEIAKTTQEAIAKTGKREEEEKMLREKLDNLTFRINFVGDFLGRGEKEEPATAPAEKAGQQPPAAPTKEAAGKGRTDKESLYAAAYELFKEAKYEKSREAFENFLKQYPDTEFSDNAQFWVGECYYFEKKYEKAIVEYEKVTKNFPEGGKVPYALLKQGLSFLELGDKASGKLLLQQVTEDYPNTSQARTARARLLEIK